MQGVVEVEAEAPPNNHQLLQTRTTIRVLKECLPIAHRLGEDLEVKQNVIFMAHDKRPVEEEVSILNDRGYSFERNCVLRRWESETLK